MFKRNICLQWQLFMIGGWAFIKAGAFIMACMVFKLANVSIKNNHASTLNVDSVAALPLLPR